MYYAPVLMTSPLLISVASMAAWSVYHAAMGTYYLYDKITNKRKQITVDEYNQLKRRLIELETKLDEVKHEKGDFGDYVIICDTTGTRVNK
jgi:hypothetical protein